MIRLHDIYKESATADGEGLMLHLGEQIRLGRHETYLEALAAYVEEKEIEPELVSKILTPTLREIIRAEAEDKHYFKGKKPKNLKDFI
jgi:hypothetical protein